MAPTVAFKKEDFTRGNVHFTAVDMSGASRYRDLWQQFYGDVDGLVFVIDASDEIRFCVARDELMQMLSDEKLTASIPLLILANKMDLPGAKTKQEVMGALDLKSICAADGRDYRKVLVQRAAEKALLNKLGLKPEDINPELNANKIKANAAKGENAGQEGGGTGEA